MKNDFATRNRLVNARLIANVPLDEPQVWNRGHVRAIAGRQVVHDDDLVLAASRASDKI